MKTKFLLAVILLCSWLIPACQPAQIPQDSPATIPPPTKTASPTDIPLPTNTPVPPTATNTPFVPKATLKIAVAMPLTGNFGSWGTDLYRGSELAVSQLSGPLELIGYAVELVPYDDMDDLDTAVSNAKELVEDPDILCGVGHLTSRLTIQATEVYHRAGLAFISPSATNTDVTKRAYLEVNRVAGRDDLQGTAGARFAQEREFKAIYLIYDQNNAFLQKNADFFKREAIQLGLNLVGELSTNSLSGFESVIGKILASNTDLVYFAGFAEQVGNFVNEARNSGYTGAVLGIDSLSTQDLLNYAGPFAIDGGGMFYTTTGASLASIPEAAQFVQDFQSRYGTEPQFFTPYAYDATGICLKAIEEASRNKGGEIPTRAEVANAIRALVDYPGITDTYTFTSKGDPTSSKFQVFQITTIDPGKWGQNPVVATYNIEPPDQ